MASSKNGKVSSEEAEGFLKKALAVYVHRFIKQVKLHLTDHLELRYGLLKLAVFVV